MWLAVAFLPFLALLGAVVLDVSWVLAVDEGVADGLHGAVRGSPAAVDVVEAVTFLGTSAALYPVCFAVAAVAFKARRAALGQFILLATVSGGILNHLVKEAVGRDRPSFPDPVEVGGGPSFPSGHAMNSAIVFGAAVVVLAAVRPRQRRALVVVGAALVAAVGFTRLALGVHWLSDVVAGWSLGLTWVGAGAWRFLRRPWPLGAGGQ